jgi:hypothetical protein
MHIAIFALPGTMRSMPRHAKIRFHSVRSPSRRVILVHEVRPAGKNSKRIRFANGLVVTGRTDHHFLHANLSAFCLSAFAS